MMRLPKQFIDRGLLLAKGMRLYGIDVLDMTRDELIAAVANGWHEEKKQRELYAGTASARASEFVRGAR